MHLTRATPPGGTSRLAAALTGLALVLVGCTSASDGGTASNRPSSPPPSSAPSETLTTPTASPSPTGSGATTAAAVVREVPPAEWALMVQAGVWHKGCPLTRTQLRRVEVNHYGFDGQVHPGAIVVNADIARAVARIFTKLFAARFPIRQMVPIEAFAGDNELSMAADNTSAYNCRRDSQANSPAMKSPHANGRAVDLGPLHNPWMDPRCHCWSPSKQFAARRAAPGIVTHGGTAWRIFTAEGWIWQDIDTLDYMHFDTGYPSLPVKGRPSPPPRS